MNDNTTIQTEFVFRRLAEPVFGVPIHWLVWFGLVVTVFSLCCFYVVRKYRRDFELDDVRFQSPVFVVLFLLFGFAGFFLALPFVGLVRLVISAVKRDGRTFNWGMASFLTYIRLLVYGLLVFVFLLPSCQHWEYSEKGSRVVILLDVSESMTKVSDDRPRPDRPADKLETRLDKVLNFLDDKQIAFLSKLMEKNPVVVYRFSSRLDEEFQTLVKQSAPPPREEWAAWARMDFKQWLYQGLSDGGRQTLRDHPEFGGDKPGDATWALQWIKKPETDTVPEANIATGFSEADRKKLLENREKLDKRIEVVRQLLQGTNVGESVLAALNREGANMVQGVILISDGRDTIGAAGSIGELRTRAQRDGIPIFSVVVGEDKQPISILITDVQTAEQAPPDEKFIVRAEIDGVGLPGKEVPVFLDIFRPSENPKKDKPAHTLVGSVKFQPGEPPHGQVEFAIDPTATEGKDKLPADFFKPIKKPDPMAPKDPMKPGDKVDESQFSTGKPELLEGEWKYVVRVPKDENEAFVGKEHAADPVSVFIVKKPLRVLLFAGGPTHEFQFLRTLLVREKDQKRAELSVFLQNEGRDGRDVQDVEPERRLARFPTTLAVGGVSVDPKLKYYNLDQYDVVIAIDPDWNELQPEQFKLLKTWVEGQAGGLVIVAGPINTFQLARADETSKLQALKDLFPVVPGDSVLAAVGQQGTRRNTKKPWYLNFPGANKDMEFLNLDDDKAMPLAGWDEFFFRKEKRDERDTEAKRGFFSVYPVQSVKKGAVVVATYGDPGAKMADGSEHPFLVTMDYPKGKIVYLGSGEMRRLRSYKEIFYERFWVKLARYAAAGRRLQQNTRGTLVMGRQFTTGSFVRLEAQMFGPDANPLPETGVEVKAFVSPLNSDDPKERKELKLSAKKSSNVWGGWFQGRHLVEVAGEYKIEVPIPGTPDLLRGKFLVKEANPELDMIRPDYVAMYEMASPIDDVEKRIADKGVVDRLRELLERRRVSVDKKDAKDVKDSGTDAKPADTADKPHLFFDLRSADIIPECMDAQTKKNKNRGKVEDLWDKGWSIGRSPTFGIGWYLTVAAAAVAVLVGVAWAVLVFVSWSRPGGRVDWARLLSPGSLLVLGIGGLVLCGGVYWLARRDPSIVLPYLLVAIVGLLSVEWLTRKLLRLA